MIHIPNIVSDLPNPAQLPPFDISEYLARYRPEPESYTYYLDGKETRSRKTTVVLLQQGHYIARGVAICNSHSKDGDQFNKKLGRAIALGRAQKALRQRKSCRKNLIVNNVAKWNVPEEFNSKCEFNPILTPFEWSLISEH